MLELGEDYSSWFAKHIIVSGKNTGNVMCIVRRKGIRAFNFTAAAFAGFPDDDPWFKFEFSMPHSHHLHFELIQKKAGYDFEASKLRAIAIREIYKRLEMNICDISTVFVHRICEPSTLNKMGFGADFLETLVGRVAEKTLNYLGIHKLSVQPFVKAIRPNIQIDVIKDRKEKQDG